MKKISIFFAAVMLSAMTFAATFTKVTSAPTDWSGEYILVYEVQADSGYVFSGVDQSKNGVGVHITSSTIEGNFTTLVIDTITKGSYSIKVKGGTNDGKYISGTNNSNKLNFKDEASAVALDIKDNSASMVSNTSVMRFNSASGSLWFRFFKASTYTTQQSVQLYKLKKQTTDPIPVTGITAVNNQDTVEVGDKLTLSYTITPDSATDQRVEFAIVSGSEYITLSNGVVTGVAEGNAQISVTALDSLNNGDKLSATYNIHVKGVTLNTCADVNAAASGDALKLNTVTAVYVIGANIYVKDDSGSTLVFLYSSGVKAGDVISGIKGTASPYNGLPELKPSNKVADWTITPGTAPAIPEALAAPTAAEVNQVMEWKNVKGMAGDFTTAGKETIKGAFGTDSIAFYNNFKLAQTFEATHSYDITGAVATYTKDDVTTVQVYFISVKDNGVITSLISTEATKLVRKAMIGGQMVIIRDGKLFNALGAEL